VLPELFNSYQNRTLKNIPNRESRQRKPVILKTNVNGLCPCKKIQFDITIKAEGEKRGYGYCGNGGSPEIANYFVATPYKNFAALGIIRNAA
jgi:hypothetical protein